MPNQYKSIYAFFELRDFELTSSNFEHLSLCVDSFWLPAKVWILAEKLARMSLAPISSRISFKNRQTF